MLCSLCLGSSFKPAVRSVRARYRVAAVLSSGGVYIHVINMKTTTWLPEEGQFFTINNLLK